VHEAGLLAAAVADAVAAAGLDGTSGEVPMPSVLLVHVRDPIHVAPESARLHAELALRKLGLEGVTIEVEADPVECVLCGVANEAYADHPFCADCGWPLPDRGGHAVEATFRAGAGPAAAPAAAPAGTPAR
jgi:hypothetical protein